MAGLGLALPVTASAAALPQATSGPASAGSPSPAPALDGAAKGGAVIVVLATQHPALSMRSQAATLKSRTQGDQAPLVAAIKAAGGTGVVQVPEPSEVAATLSPSAIAALQANPAVKEIIPDPQVQVAPANPLPQPPAAMPAAPAAGGNACPFNPDPSQPLQEGEANINIHASNGIPGAPGEGNSIVTGKGVIIANEGVNELAGNPNFIRPDGTSVVLDAPTPLQDDSNDEFYGDASSIAAQGSVVYQYSKALPASTLPIPADCTFVIRGDAPDASLLDLSNTPFSGGTQSVAQIQAGMAAAVANGADVISESFGEVYMPGAASQLFEATDDAAVAAGVTVVASAGDNGESGTMNAPAMDPNIISAAGTDSLRLVATDDGYAKYVSDNISALSSGGTAPTNRLPDLSAPSWYGGEAACAEGVGGCPTGNPTESMRGTSESAPLISGAAADVIQAYRDSHGGASPTPAQVKDILTSTATDISAPADEGGSGLLNVYAAVKAAQEMPGSTAGGNGSAAVVATPSQLDLQGNGRSATSQTVSLYNTASRPVTVTGTYRQLGPQFQVGKVVTEPVSAPDPSLPVPHEGATAAQTIHFTVGSVGRLDLDMIWPDPTNNSRLYFQVFNPRGALVQESYDDGSNARGTRPGTIPNIQHAEVSAPQPGRWTVKVLWGGVDQDLALPQGAPGTFTGNLQFRVAAQDWQLSPATGPVTIPAHASRAVPLRVSFPAAPGDHPETVQFASVGFGGHELTSFPIARRTLIPSAGGNFQTLLTSSVGRNQGGNVGQVETFKMNVPAGLAQLSVTFHAPDTAANNEVAYFLVGPDGTLAAQASTPNTTGPDPGTQTLTATAPAAGLWEIDVILGLTVSGNEFDQTVQGSVTETG